MNGAIWTKPIAEHVKKLDIPPNILVLASIAQSQVVEGEAKLRAPVGFGTGGGELKQKIAATKKVVLAGTGGAITSVIAAAKHSAFVEIGTGIYGPKKRRITPTGNLYSIKTRRVVMLSWIDRATGKRVFARSVKGMRAQPYLGPGAMESGKAQVEGVKDVITRWLKGIEER